MKKRPLKRALHTTQHYGIVRYANVSQWRGQHVSGGVALGHDHHRFMDLETFMRIIALLSLIIGFLWQLLLDGQTFTHAVGGIICGALAMACGVVSARKEHANAVRRWEGRIMAGLGLLLAVACIVLLPSAYRFQAKFNERRSVLPQVQEPTPNGLK